MFNSEAEFEAALIKKLTDECGWDKKILRNYSEKDLIKNWADILFGELSLQVQSLRKE
ncbi:hypothetical protein MESMUL_20200 [Mesosutterella multiformis]|uniref:Uncharacterized protein n=1 Tax=Mesosutterella multiformis TaxID=2259133 RepID=A0A388SEG6_9BURK|nr:hypothetical protein [Mesosutterella multiformis]GBO94666.1 hypothetical protein MESMUL_20200 [Mesosutterella multiformis]